MGIRVDCQGGHVKLQSGSALLAACAATASLLGPASAALADGDTGGAAVAFERAGEVPEALRVPGGHRIVFEAIVTAGTQTYRCAPEGKYVLLGPTAMLRGHAGQYTAHFFGPAWQYQDGSVVVGKVIAKEPRANAVDQLLLQIAQHDGRPGLFSDVDYVQRLATTGGVAPPQCDPARDTTLAVAYSAIYQFWAPAT